MSIETWLAFVFFAILACTSPGPNMLMMLSNATQHGVRQTLPLMAGCFVSVIIVLIATIAGIGTLLKTATLLLDIIRYAGAAYLIYIGILSWRAGDHAQAFLPADVHDSRLWTKKFRQGLFLGLSNPKAYLFFGAVFSQFIDANLPLFPQAIIFSVTLLVIEFCSYMLYASGGATLRRFIKNPAFHKIFSRLMGGVFIAFGLLFLFFRVH
ncbi:MAG: LysE family translocator [Pseudomonadota bacterium]